MAITQGCRAEVVEPEEMARRVVAQASFSWTCGPIHLLAPYEAENTAQTDSPLRGGSIPPGGQSEAGVPIPGWQPIPFMLQWQAGGNRKAEQRFYARSAS